VKTSRRSRGTRNQSPSCQSQNASQFSATRSACVWNCWLCGVKTRILTQLFLDQLSEDDLRNILHVGLLAWPVAVPVGFGATSIVDRLKD
jgi:hypothetical protein